MRHPTLRMVAVSLMSGCGLLVACRPAAPPASPPMVVRYAEARPAGESAPSARAAYLGAVRGDEELDLGFKVGGIVERIGPADGTGDWQEGVEVAQGEVLAQLKQAEFINAYETAKARADLAQKEFGRAETLRRDGAVSEQDFDTRQAEKTSAEANLAQRKQDLDDSKLVAPFPGTILARLVKSGETIGPGRTVLRFASMERMSVELGVPERVVSRLKVDAPVRVEVPALRDRQFAGRITEVGVAAKEVGRLFKVVIKIPNADRALKSGMTADVRLDDPYALPRHAVLVPLSALVTRAGGQLAVFVVDTNGIARERPVQTDDFVRSSIIITAGVQVGEKVVVVGAPNLHDGAVVVAQPQPVF